MKKIIYLFLICNIFIYAGEREERLNIGNNIKTLFLEDNITQLSTLSQTYCEKSSRTLGGRWKLRFYFTGISKAFNQSNKSPKYWNSLEDKILNWVNKEPNNPTFHIIYTEFLIRKAWMYRGTSYARAVTKENWKLFHQTIKQAKQYHLKHKKIASQNPHWYFSMITIALAESLNKKDFLDLLDESLSRYPNYYPIYESALYYMSPYWNNFNANEIENIAQSILKYTKDKDGAYSRFYWMAKDVIYKNNLFSKSKIDRKIMKSSIQQLIKSYPTQYNINSFAYISCLDNDIQNTHDLIEQIQGSPNLKIWKTKNNFDRCNSLSSKDDKKSVIKIIKPSNLELYLQTYSSSKPLYIYFASHKEGATLSEVNKIERVAKKYQDKINFITVNFFPKNRIFNYPSLRRRFHLIDIPNGILMYKNKVILWLEEFNNLQEEVQFLIINEALKEILLELNDDDFLSYFKSDLNDNASYFNTSTSGRVNVRDYKGYSYKYKTLMIASSIKNHTWVAGGGYSNNSQKEATDQALNKCANDKKQHNIEEECTIYMIGNEYLYEKNRIKNNRYSTFIKNIKTLFR